MDLTEKTVENVEIMIEKIKEKLKVLNLGAIKPSHFDENMYAELKDIYELVMKKNASTCRGAWKFTKTMKFNKKRRFYYIIRRFSLCFR